MAALYLHNAIFTPEPTDSPREHTRTISSTTLRTITTDQSHPTEPLLHSTNSGSLAYRDLLSRQPEYSHRRDDELSFDDLASTSKEKQGHWEQSVRKRLRLLKLTGFVLKLVLGIWALYNTVRYFIAYTIYESLHGQIVAIALGTSTAVCLAFLICATILSASHSYLIRARIPIHSLLVMRTVFRYLGSFFLASPAVVNLALVIIWRRSVIPEFIPELRCHLDIDVVWSVTTAACSNRTTAAQWLGLSIFRVVFTLFVIALFLYISSAYTGTRRPSQSSQRRKRRRRRSRSDQSVHMSPPPTSTSASSQVPLSPGHPSRHPSRSTVTSLGNSRSTLDRSLRTSHTSSSEFYPSSPDDDESSLDLPRFDPVLMQQRLNNAIPPPTTSTSSNTQNDRELNNFAERFRSLVSQISRETDDALRIAQSDTYDPVPLVDAKEDANQSYTPYNNDYGNEYPPDDHIQFLNGVVRRMPTIESLGSRELVSSIASSQDRDRDRFSSLSRPPTRSVTDFTGSDPPSRANSLSLTAAIGGYGLTPTEMGELIEKIEKENSNSTVTTGPASASRSTFSYYTAQSNHSNGRTSSPAPLTPTSDHFPSSLSSPT